MPILGKFETTLGASICFVESHCIFLEPTPRCLTRGSKLEKEKPGEYPLDAVLFHKASALELKGDIPGALAVYKKLQEEYTQTYYGYEASLKVGRLEAAKRPRP